MKKCFKKREDSNEKNLLEAGLFGVVGRMSELRQTPHTKQQQVLAPWLRQGLDILQSSSLELEQLVRKEVEMNPAIEEVVETEQADDVDDISEDGDEEIKELLELEDGWKSFSAEGAQNADAESEENRRESIIGNVSPSESLAQHLELQVGRLLLDGKERQAMDLLVGNLDEDGYLAVPLGAIAEESGVELRKVEELLEALHGLDPAGIGARDLRECLKLQLLRNGESEGLAMRIVEDALDLLGQKNFPAIAAALGVTLDEVREAGLRISQLNPRPGRALEGQVAQALVPDVVIERVGESYVASLARDSVPRLRISRMYRDLLGSEDSAEVRDYLREKIKSGKLLIKNIEQREQTILSVTREIIRKQHAFLEGGMRELAPMTMSEIAAAIGIHEATVSRAVSGKVVETPQGIFEMKDLFSKGYHASDGAEVSRKGVKEMMAALIKNEDTTKPLSDQKIVDLLDEAGLSVARRTVASYREELGILPAHLRKSF